MMKVLDLRSWSYFSVHKMSNGKWHLSEKIRFVLRLEISLLLIKNSIGDFNRLVMQQMKC